MILNLAARIAGIIPNRLKRTVYNIAPLANLVRGILNQAAPTEPEIVELAGGEVKGLRMKLNLQTEKDHWLGTYEMPLQKAFIDWMQPGKTAYDVGANIGFMTLLLARIAGAEGQVFSFEALPGNVKRLKENAALNMCISAVNPVPYAVVDKQKEVDFHVHASSQMGKAAGSAGRDETYLEKITVPGISLDEFVFEENNPPPDLIKLDIEGGEVMAVPGMERILNEHSPMLFIEIHGQEAAEICWNTLTAAGYTLFTLDEGYPPIKSLAELDWKAYVMARKI